MIQSRCFSIDELGGGRFRQTISLKPTQYNKGGGWLDIANVVGVTGDPALSLGADELVQFRIRPKLSGNAPMFHFGKGDTHVRMTPLNTANVDGVVKGNKITYPGAWPNTSGLIYELGGHVLRKRIPLLAGHPTSFSFRIDAHVGLNTDTLQTGDFRICDPYLVKPGGDITDQIPLTWAKSTSGGKLILTATLPEGKFAGWEFDPTITLQPDATAGIDAVLLAAVPTWNFGANVTILEATTQIGLIKFDLSGYPANPIVSSAILSLYRHTTKADNTSLTIAAYSIASGNTAWIEGVQTAGVAATGEPCWNFRVYNTVGWAGSAGLATVNTDYEASAMGTSASFKQSDAAGTEIPISLNTTRIAGWFGGSNTNYGIKLVESIAMSGGGIASSDNTTAGYRPKLVVEYTSGSKLSQLHPLGVKRILSPLGTR